MVIKSVCHQIFKQPRKKCSEFFMDVKDPTCSICNLNPIMQTDIVNNSVGHWDIFLHFSNAELLKSSVVQRSTKNKVKHSSFHEIDLCWK